MLPNRRLPALVLSLAYGLIAVAGHGLHALTPCGDADCQQVASHCDCGCHVKLLASDPAGQQPAFGTNAGDGHNPHTCAFCALLSKVKVGHGQVDSASLEVDVFQPESANPEPAALATFIAAHSPRGPPAA